MSNDEYYRLRLEEELKAAESAPDASIAQIHREMAERYRELVNGNVAMAPVGAGIVEPGPLPA